MSNFESARQRMVEQQLRSRGITNVRVLAAMAAVPREEFVAFSQRGQAYEDRPLSIGWQQTISQPFTVAYQCQALQLVGEERVLEVGTGCGYAAAVLSQLAAEVHTVERIDELVERAKETFQRLNALHDAAAHRQSSSHSDSHRGQPPGPRRTEALLSFKNVHVHAAGASLGWPPAAPYDAIVVAAAAERLPQELVDQLADGGRLVIPVGPSQDTQTMQRITRHGSRLAQEQLGRFAFVPLIT